jgi:Helix-loop-helix DNA-binding domain
MTNIAQEDPFYLSPSTPGSLAFSGNHDHSSAGIWSSWRDTGAFRCSQCHLKVDEVNPWFTLEPTPYETQTVDPPPCNVGKEKECISWDYGKTAVLTLSEQQQIPQHDQSTCDSPPMYLKSNHQSHSFPVWHGFAPGPKPMWNTSPCDASIASYVLPPDADTSDEALFFPDSFSVPPLSPIQPSQRRTSSTSTISSELLQVSRDLCSLPLSSATTQGQDKQNITTPGQTLLEECPSHPATPPSPLSPKDDLPSLSKKRKASTEAQEQKNSHNGPKSRILQLAGHNLIEKRYRNKLNAEIATLRDRVPSLRLIPKRSEEYAYREGSEKLKRPEPSNKFDKATIVSKAVEYILYLEMCNKRLGEERLALKNSVSALHKIALSGLQCSE